MDRDESVADIRAVSYLRNDLFDMKIVIVARNAKPVRRRAGSSTDNKHGDGRRNLHAIYNFYERTGKLRAAMMVPRYTLTRISLSTINSFVKRP